MPRPTPAFHITLQHAQLSQMGHIRADVDHPASQELPCSQIGITAHFPEYPKADGLSLTSLNVLDYMTLYPKTALPWIGRMQFWSDI